MNRLLLIFFFIAMFAAPLAAQDSLHTFALGDSAFLLDGKPFQIISGEMHYARIPKEYWRHRLRMAHAMGLNTISTCVFWNYHEPWQGDFDFTTENRNLAQFIAMAQEEGLWVILRPGPYVCAEWEFGGFPWWLLKKKDLAVRGQDPRFLKACESYIKHLCAEIKSLQVTHGGPIILCQIENEYGSFGADKTYMGVIRNMFVNAGIDVPLFTADGPSQCRDGCVEGVLPAINGEESASALRDTVRRYNNGKGPFFIPEFYPGWLDNWGVHKSIVPADNTVDKFRALLKAGVSVNLYMFHGGTNFGFINGANYSNDYPEFPQTTSYDYDAPLDEAGRPTQKYFKFRDAIAEHLTMGPILPPVPETNKIITIPPFQLTQAAGLNSLLKTPAASVRPLPMEELDQAYGCVLYRTVVKEAARGVLKIFGLHDYGIVFLNGKRVAVLDWRLRQDSAMVTVAEANSALDILVENEGRINFGSEMIYGQKGIAWKVLFGGAEVLDWKMYSLPFDDFKKIRYDKTAPTQAPVLRRGSFTLAETGDGFLDMTKWGKGCVWVNGHNLGRYWYIGPQQTLYVPGPWLKTGKNEIVVFEQLNAVQNEVRGVAAPVLDSLRTQKVLFHPAYDQEQKAVVLGMSCDDKDAIIRFTLDGTEPSTASERYHQSLEVKTVTNVTARAFKDEIVAAPATKATITPSLSTGKNVTVDKPYSGKYTGGGGGALADGVRGTLNFRDGRWQGYEGNDCIATIDLGDTKRISKISAEFLQDIDSWIFLPLSVEFSVSNDGASFTVIQTSPSLMPPNKTGAFVRSFAAQTNAAVRYVKVIARNIVNCPPWHKGAGKKAWMFVDEISVE